MLLLLQILETLPPSKPGLFNPFADRCPQDTEFNGPEARKARLAAHMDCEAKLIVVGEFQGHLGSRHTGIPFTSERQLLKGGMPRIPKEDHRLTTAPTVKNEPSAQIVWRALTEQGLASETILWNVLLLHPYKPGNINSNRYPSPAELRIGYPGLKMLVEAFPTARYVALGKSAKEALDAVGAKDVIMATHPGHGGGESFSQAVSAIK